MAVGKVIEISSASKESFEDAIQQGINRAAESVDDIKQAWIKEQKVVIENNQIVEYRVDMKVTFLIHK